MTKTPKRIIITGAAGLVGQNLVTRLKKRPDLEIVGIDKHPANVRILRQLHPEIEVIEADLAKPGGWEHAFDAGGTLILNHAQIGALTEQPFIDNNITATKNVLAAAQRAGLPYLVHISSSVVESMAHDFYTESKKVQEKLVLDSGIPACVLRPTLMYGWFDRKHLGWLARFMHKSPIFPIPGSGKYIRQPLYAGDLCNIIISAADTPRPNTIYNISGREKVYYIDLIRAVKKASRAKAMIVRIPYGVFYALMAAYALVDKNPPFTTQQLKALVTPDEFDIIDWPGIFGVQPHTLVDALEETFQDPVYSHVKLEF
ncbi:NAD(P)-dependent oxidoreductase [Acetobacter sp. TBRC 12305]|uniref:NAD(P)-dependent oxidoreductase n=1 Tax=Acetobacter garciniae TaxID=2817435 RepID=A0A939HGL8_9PROT|nr:NAD(P)-dependent oxidoreductase [Acetobacter garciniae]MBO1324028.1 NAD(P)-dependent oxidoreductase [Acetobacter garciniae]MBX0343717.1 NAD(P)-dependent oxidoreductase [Acetobacter garciniae]